MKKIRFFVDFDGTITQKDVIDAVLERFAPDAWKQIEKEWSAGRIGSRECLSRQTALVRAKKAQFDQLLEEVKIDPFFVAFLEMARQRAIPVVIVSDGLDYVIKTILSKPLREAGIPLESLPVFSNRLLWKGTGIGIGFPAGPACVHGCANCKEKVIAAQLRKGESAVFIGDGLSDRFAAAASALTFAKGKLLEHCRQNRLAHLAYGDFSDVIGWMPGNGKNKLRPSAVLETATFDY